MYCLPDGYEVADQSLNDVRYMLDPRFTRQDVARLDKVSIVSEDVLNLVIRA